MPRTTKPKPEAKTAVVSAYLEAVKDIPEVQMVVVSGRAPDWVRLMTFALLPDDYDEETPILHRIFGAELAARDSDPAVLVYFELHTWDENCGYSLENAVPAGYRVLYRKDGSA